MRRIPTETFLGRDFISLIAEFVISMEFLTSILRHLARLFAFAFRPSKLDD